MKNAPYPYYDIPQVKTIRELIEYGRDQGGEKPIFYLGKKDETPVSFREVYSYAEYIGTYLYSQGLHEAKIAILGENSAVWSITYFGIVTSGNVAVPLDRALPAEEIAELIIRCGCEAVFYSDSYQDYADELQRDNSLFAPRFYRLADFESYTAEGRRLIEAGDREYAEHKVLPNDLACIVYTSGTSGKSKGVMLSHGNLATDVVATCMCVTARNTEVFLPLNHTFSWASSMFAAFLYSVDAHIAGNLKRMVKDLNKNKPQNFSAVPMMVEMIYKNIWDNAKKQGTEEKLRRGLRISRTLMTFGIDKRKQIFRPVHEALGGNLELIICGGASLDADLQRGFYDMGINVINGYGITECSPVVAVNRNNHFRFGSVGQPLPCNRVRIHEPDEDGIGEIYVAGSNVMLGYYDDPEATADAFDGEWFKTGDYGYIDKDGFLFITGRKKNLIILSNGKNVSPEELEEKLRHIPYVQEVAVYEEKGKIAAEFYLNTEDFPDAPARLKTDVDEFNRIQPPYKNINVIKLRSVPFEKTTTMKIKRYRLHEDAAAVK